MISLTRIADGTLVATSQAVIGGGADGDGSLTIFHFGGSDGQLLETAEAKIKLRNRPRIQSSSGTKLSVTNSDRAKETDIYDLATGKRERTFKGFDHPSGGVVTGTWILAHGGRLVGNIIPDDSKGEPFFRVHDTASGKTLHKVDAQQLSAVAVFQYMDQLALVCRPSIDVLRVCLVDNKDFSLKAAMEIKIDSQLRRVMGEGKHFVVETIDDNYQTSYQVFDLETGKLVRNVSGKLGIVRALSPGLEYAAVSSGSKVLLQDFVTGELAGEVCDLQRINDNPNFGDFAFSKDSKNIVITWELEKYTWGSAAYVIRKA